MISGVPPEELVALAQASLDGMHGCVDFPRYSEPGVCCRWCHRAGTAAAAAHSNYRMMTAVRSVGCPVPHRRAPLIWACRPGWDGVGTAVDTRPHRTSMSTLGSSATARTLSCHNRPAEVRLDMPGTGVEQSTGKGETGERTPPRPGCFVLRAGNELITNPLTSLVLPGVIGVGQGGPEQIVASPSRPQKSACFRHGYCWSASPG
jgi:hypothetical protein